jgi:hypothetical protein
MPEKSHQFSLSDSWKPWLARLIEKVKFYAK